MKILYWWQSQRISIAEAQETRIVIRETEDQDLKRDIVHIAVGAIREKNKGAGVGKGAKGIEATKDETRAEAEKDTDTEATVKIRTSIREVEVLAERES